MSPEPARRVVSLLEQIRAEKDSLIRGATLVLGGMALVLAGTLIGLGESKFAAVAAGTLATTGIVVAFLGFFIYVLPPLLPAK
jgi:hypothetical protein